MIENLHTIEKHSGKTGARHVLDCPTRALSDGSATFHLGNWGPRAGWGAKLRIQVHGGPLPENRTCAQSRAAPWEDVVPISIVENEHTIGKHSGRTDAHHVLDCPTRVLLDGSATFGHGNWGLRTPPLNLDAQFSGQGPQHGFTGRRRSALLNSAASLFHEEDFAVWHHTREGGG